MRLFFILFLLSLSVKSETFSDSTFLCPQDHSYRSFEDINRISIESYDWWGLNVTLYLNAGSPTMFDVNTSLIHCSDVKKCEINNLFLQTGTYTLFVYNNHTFKGQDVFLKIDYWTVKEEIYFSIGIGASLLCFLITCTFIYCAFCHENVKAKLCRCTFLRKRNKAYPENDRIFLL
jgi:hypothetical protein